MINLIKVDFQTMSFRLFDKLTPTKKELNYIIQFDKVNAYKKFFLSV